MLRVIFAVLAKAVVVAELVDRKAFAVHLEAFGFLAVAGHLLGRRVAGFGFLLGWDKFAIVEYLYFIRLLFFQGNAGAALLQLKWLGPVLALFVRVICRAVFGVFQLVYVG